MSKLLLICCFVSLSHQLFEMKETKQNEKRCLVTLQSDNTVIRDGGLKPYFREFNMKCSDMYDPHLKIGGFDISPKSPCSFYKRHLYFIDRRWGIDRFADFFVEDEIIIESVKENNRFIHRTFQFANEDLIVTPINCDKK